MKITILGAGAVGGHIAARLAKSGTPVSVIARGVHLAAIKARGLMLRVGGETFTTHPEATDRPADLGPQDLVVVSVKGPSLPAAMDVIAPLLSPDTRVLLAMNGLPWWFLDGLPVEAPPGLRRLLDPTGRMDSIIPRERAAACVITSGGRIVEPGVIENTTPNLNILTLGFADGRDDAVVGEFAALAVRAGYKSALTPTIRVAIWTKLFINAAAAMVAALVHRPTSETASDPELAAIILACINEIVAIGRAIGVNANVDPAAVLAAMKTHHHRPSVLQDLEAGRPLELDATILAVRDLARATGVSAPHLTTIAALIAARSPAM